MTAMIVQNILYDYRVFVRTYVLMYELDCLRHVHLGRLRYYLVIRLKKGIRASGINTILDARH